MYRHESPAGEPAPRKPRKKKKFSFWRFLWKTIACCFCLGVMAASVLAVMLSMYVVEVTADDATLLDLDNMRLSYTTIVYAQNSETGEWEEYDTLSRDNQRIWVSLDEIPEDLRWAVICTEDKDFYESVGVNFKRTIGAAINEYTPFKIYSGRQGASTLEQQLIKNISGDDEQDAMRKVREIFRALGLDNRYSKDTILEAYMNTISLTGTIAGVQSGAREYFGKEVTELNLQECASLASITKSPTQYNPITNPEQHLQRRNHVLWNMYDQGKITEAEYKAASSAPLVLAEEEQLEVITKTSNNSYFIDALINQLAEDIIEKDESISTEAEALDKIYNGGLRIYATVDPFVQQSMEEVMLNKDDEYFPAYWREEEVKALGENDI
ncbi:MAG: penicillin-binding protein, partial [Oscillospiraceae bacterium]|nr:penicillin-binding protein [Oscillospiraceae bacterium]